jgi:hypothetical protein
MSATPHAGENVSQLCLQLHRVSVTYGLATRDRALAEAAYKTARAKRKLTARATSEAKSMAEADMVADADHSIAGLHQNYLIADAWVDTLKGQMGALKERIGYGRSVMADQREADKQLSMAREIT